MPDNMQPNEPDPQIEAALEKYQEAFFRGNPPEPDTFCAPYPDIAEPLRARIENFLQVAEGLPGLAGGKGGKAPMPAAAPKVSAGQVLGDFRIIREIGRGGMGVVYEAEQISLKRSVALKVLPAHLSFSERAVMKFRREAEAGGRQQHPGIVAVYAVGEDQGVHFIAQELVRGGTTLEDKLENLAKEDSFPLGYYRQAAQLVARVADAMQHAHDSGVIHRDIKPSNLLLTGEGTPKITDFGLARVEDALALSRSGDFAGTPYYMSPEQAASRRHKIDHRTDIFSLGVTLYEMLTLVRPFQGDTSQEVLKKILFAEPKDPRRINPRAPRDLAVICLRAMEKEPNNRYRTMNDLREDLERYLHGEVIVARLVGPAGRFLKWVKRNPVVSLPLGVALAFVLFFLGYQLLWSYPHLKMQYEKILRLSDQKRLAELKEEADMLWPAFPEKTAEIELWIRRAEALLDRLEPHRITLNTLREQALPEASDPEDEAERAWRFEDLELQWQHDLLHELIAELQNLGADKEGLLANMKERLRFASTIGQRSIEDHYEAWVLARASIADEKECSSYKGLTIEPQLGLVPLGRDPESGLWEFAHLQTGDPPSRDEKGKLVLTEETGLVFVLIPGGTFQMGAMPPSEEHPLGSANVEPDAKSDQGPVHAVTLNPFFLSKYEMTQAQWFRFTNKHPSMFGPRSEFSPARTLLGKAFTLLHPVEFVSWDDCSQVLSRLGLRLPAEAEWEYAARAGTSTIWWTGNEKESLDGAANLSDRAPKNHGIDPPWEYEAWLDDGYYTHAPVGSFRANAFGLHDVCGNVWEWCQDTYGTYPNAPTDGSAREGSAPHRIVRGGSWLQGAFWCTSANRFMGAPDTRQYHLGVRPALSVYFQEEAQ
ncbi:MAG: SUMF1/EgtB/PvdO family nonheme iron enzyme [Planctomycetes bacterium]|nr:SUMF1/EgtB/PvdO family nonheme iron enzyme [Planctomycetota bacterium]